MLYETKRPGARPLSGEYSASKNVGLLLSSDLKLNVFRPKEFVKQSILPEDSDDEDSNVGKLPSSDDEDK
jgi:hypothetical protein